MLEKAILDITKIRTVEDLNSVDFSKYADDRFLTWVRHINSPVTSNDLDRVSDLSEEVGAKVILGWTLGELYYKVRALPQIKRFSQTFLLNDK